MDNCAQKAPPPVFLLDRDTRQLVENLIVAALLECCPVQEFARLGKTELLATVTAQACDDLSAFALKDPASGRDPALIAHSYTSYAAVLHYRIAHWLYRHRPHPQSQPLERSLPATLSRRGKLVSGAEIHFRSEIGERFIIDHGIGTVIGETSVIGDDCYILGGVTLGARGIDNNPAERRHPRIGNRVQIGAFASVLGQVHVGDDAFIGPGCIITSDVPAGARVKVKTALQVTRPRLAQGDLHA